MTEEALRRTSPPPPAPRMAAWIAVSLEAGIVLTFFSHGSIFGLLLCLGYGWFSATWAVLSNRLKDD